MLRMPTRSEAHLFPLQGHMTETCLLMIVVASIPQSFSNRRFAPVPSVLGFGFMSTECSEGGHSAV